MHVPALPSLFARRLDPLTALAQSVARLSDQGVSYTRRQLYYEVCRTLVQPAQMYRTASEITAVVGASLTLVVRRSRPLWAGIVGATALGTVASLVRRLSFTITPPLPEGAFAEALTIYRARHGEPSGLLADDPPPPPIFNHREPDLYDYGIPYTLVCQDDTIARMLRANAIHMDMGCVILALAEASPLPDRVLSMLMLTPAPRVLLLHDASPEGLRFASDARRLLDLPQDIQVRALGLRPRHALQQHLFAIRRASLTDETSITLGSVEQRWLRAGHITEVAALSPVTLLRALRRTIHPERRHPSWFSRLRRWHAIGYMTWPE